MSCRGRFPGPTKTPRREVEKRIGIGTGPGVGGGGAVEAPSTGEVNKDHTYLQIVVLQKCREALQPMPDERSKRIHAARRYSTTSWVCIVWNRDVDACCNVRDVFFHESSHHGGGSDRRDSRGLTTARPSLVPPQFSWHALLGAKCDERWTNKGRRRLPESIKLLFRGRFGV